MSSAVVVQVADAVVATLNAASVASAFSQSITAARSYQPEYKLSDLATLRATVVPETADWERQTRVAWQEDYKVSLAIQHRSSMTGADLDALMLLVQEVADYLRSHPLATLGLTCVAIQNVPIYAPDHLAELRTFTSVLILTYRTWR